MCGVAETVPLKPCAAHDGPFAKLVSETVNTAMAAAAIRITLLACFIFLSSRSNWPLGRGENKRRARADSESERNAWDTKQWRSVWRQGARQNSNRTAPNEALAKSKKRHRGYPYRAGKRTVNGIDTAAEYTDGVCSRSLVFLIAGTLALTND